MNPSKINDTPIFRRDDPATNVPQTVFQNLSPNTVKMDDVSKIERMLDKPILFRLRSRGRSPIRIRRSSSRSSSRSRRSSSRSRRNKFPHTRSVVVEEEFVMPLERTHEGRPLSRTSSEKRARRTWKKTAKKLNRMFGYTGNKKIAYSSSATSVSSSSSASSKKR